MKPRSVIGFVVEKIKTLTTCRSVSGLRWGTALWGGQLIIHLHPPKALRRARRCSPDSNAASARRNGGAEAQSQAEGPQAFWADTGSHMDLQGASELPRPLAAGNSRSSRLREQISPLRCVRQSERETEAWDRAVTGAERQPCPEPQQGGEARLPAFRCSQDWFETAHQNAYRYFPSLEGRVRKSPPTVRAERLRDRPTGLALYKSLGPGAMHAGVQKQMADCGVAKPLSISLGKSWLLGRVHGDWQMETSLRGGPGKLQARQPHLGAWGVCGADPPRRDVQAHARRALLTLVSSCLRYHGHQAARCSRRRRRKGWQPESGTGQVQWGIF